MVELPVVSVLRDGTIENLTVWAENLCEDEPDVEVRGMTVGGEAYEQLRIAKKAAQAFLGRPYVQPLVARTLEKDKIVVESERDQAYEGPSFGLAFLVACLAVGLGVKVRRRQLFSASLTGRLSGVGMPGGGVCLGSVGEIGAKLAAACLERQSRLYLRSDEEHKILQFEQGFWRGEVSRSCLPYTLPEYISTAAVAAMALDSEQVLEKAISVDGRAAFLLLMFTVGADLPNGASIMEGIGYALAHLRQKGKLSDVEFLGELLADLGFDDPIEPEHLLLHSFKPCLAACSTDKMRAETVKAVISSDPKLPMFSKSVVRIYRSGDSDQTDLDLWLARAEANGFTEFVIAPQILRVCSQLAPDFEGYWSEAKKFVLGGLSKYLSEAVQLTASGQERRAQALLSTLRKCDLGNSIGRLNPAFVREAKDLVGSSLAQLKKYASSEIAELAGELQKDLARYQLPEALVTLEENRKPMLKLTFQLADRAHQARQATGPTFLPRPPLEKYNNLELLITGPHGLALCVPSPVLLFENAHGQSSYCRRRDMTLADNTMSRYPENDAGAAVDNFDDEKCNVVAFRVRTGGETPPASVRWLSNVNPWPPAIDSQFLAACIAADDRGMQPHRIVDIGCGTGYLAIVAAHRWPSLEDIHLVDIDALAIAAARTNLGEDSIAGSLDIRAHWRGFSKFNERGFDVLLCAPPYLPERPLPVSGIEVSTNGTLLLEEVVRRGSQLSKELWLAFSTFAWPEFQRALSCVPQAYEQVEVLRREFVPFRISWLEPVPPEDDGSGSDFVEHRKYYDNILKNRGLVDMDDCGNWPAYLEHFSPELPAHCGVSLIVTPGAKELEDTLDVIRKDSRGYRFWHEVRVVRLTTSKY